MRSVLLRMRNVSGRSFRENEHIFFSINIFQILCHLRDKVEKCNRAGEAVDNMVHAHSTLGT